MKTSEIREKNIGEIERILGEKQEELRKLRFDMASKQSKNTRGIRGLKKDISRVITIINEKKNDGK